MTFVFQIILMNIKSSECENNNDMEINRHTTYTEEKIPSIRTSVDHLNI